ncbi:MAG: SnoaL-like domain-containing protein [Acidimicrobiia bacterium]|nr:nuclear transport factor 2 family protein [Acidimicrobiia bacterium]MBT8192552.1 nuclear transport factor 2 family protein [Acidimicrobiia bacterium]NNF89430.1 SnoaL-like domain-containing protein [Acidimicrobiia bacterium]NNJ47648.1 SnoaL-like domain-containing protein [Acidimicrobiia bacterium]NNL13689.1 SnoaL-like domain-containing protein [Acidimicrobiia bacterium]
MENSHLASVFRALEALDVEALLDHYASEFRFEDTAAGVDIVDRGQLRSYFEALFSMPGVAFRVLHWFGDDGGNGTGEWVWSGLGPNGARFEVKGASVFELGPDGITRETIYYKPPGAGVGMSGV